MEDEKFGDEQFITANMSQINMLSFYSFSVKRQLLQIAFVKLI